MEKIIYFYGIFELGTANKYIYVGLTNDLKERTHTHYRSGKNLKDQMIDRHIFKNGKENFRCDLLDTVTYECNTEKQTINSAKKTELIQQEYFKNNTSFDKLAKKYNISRSTIKRIIYKMGAYK